MKRRMNSFARREMVREVRAFYAPAKLVCWPRTDGGFGIFSPNADMSLPPYTLGVGPTENTAWKHAYDRVQKEKEKTVD